MGQEVFRELDADVSMQVRLTVIKVLGFYFFILVGFSNNWDLVTFVIACHWCLFWYRNLNRSKQSVTSDVKNAFVQGYPSSQDVQVRLGCARPGPGPGIKEPPFFLLLNSEFPLGTLQPSRGLDPRNRKIQTKAGDKGGSKVLKSLSIPYSRANLLLTGGF